MTVMQECLGGDAAGIGVVDVGRLLTLMSSALRTISLPLFVACYLSIPLILKSHPAFVCPGVLWPPLHAPGIFLFAFFSGVVFASSEQFPLSHLVVRATPWRFRFNFLGLFGSCGHVLFCPLAHPSLLFLTLSPVNKHARCLLCLEAIVTN